MITSRAIEPQFPIGLGKDRRWSGHQVPKLLNCEPRLSLAPPLNFHNHAPAAAREPGHRLA